MEGSPLAAALAHRAGQDPSLTIRTFAWFHIPSIQRCFRECLSGKLQIHAISIPARAPASSASEQCAHRPVGSDRRPPLALQSLLELYMRRTASGAGRAAAVSCCEYVRRALGQGGRHCRIFPDGGLRPSLAQVWLVQPQTPRNAEARVVSAGLCHELRRNARRTARPAGSDKHAPLLRPPRLTTFYLHKTLNTSFCF
jgi:hypothetical protein